MKNYFMLLWVRYRIRLIVIALFLTVLSITSSITSLEDSLEEFNKGRAFVYLRKENPELVKRYIDYYTQEESPTRSDHQLPGNENADNEVLSYEQISKNKRIKNEFEVRTERIQNELTESRAKITSQDITDMKNSFKDIYKSGKEVPFEYEHEMMSQLKLKSSKTELYEGMSLQNQESEPKDHLQNDIKKKLAEIDNIRNVLAITAFDSPISLDSIGILVVLFSFLTVGNITSLEAMGRYKFFDESIPLSKRKKYLIKALFAVVCTASFFLIQMLLVYFIYSLSPYSQIMDLSELAVVTLKTLLGYTGVALTFTLIGSYCGNIVSYIGSIGVFMLQPMIFNTVIFMTSINLLPDKISDVIISDGSDLLISSMLIPALSLFRGDVSGIFYKEGVLGFFFLSRWLVISLFVILLGLFLSKYTKAERIGMFYIIEPVSKIYYVLLTALSAVIPVVIFNFDIYVSESNIIVNWIVFLILLIGFGKLYKHLFKAKLSI